jgi:hypothetical protein
MFEFKHERLAPLSVFVKRMAVSVAMAGILIAVALLIGIMGYHHIARFDWVDSILEASMILGEWGLSIRWLRREQKYLLPVMHFLADWYL